MLESRKCCRLLRRSVFLSVVAKPTESRRRQQRQDGQRPRRAGDRQRSVGSRHAFGAPSAAIDGRNWREYAVDSKTAGDGLSGCQRRQPGFGGGRVAGRQQVNAQAERFPDQLLQISLPTTDMRATPITTVTAGVDFKLVARSKTCGPPAPGCRLGLFGRELRNRFGVGRPDRAFGRVRRARRITISLDSARRDQRQGRAFVCCFGHGQTVLWTAVVHANSPGTVDFNADRGGLGLAFPGFCHWPGSRGRICRTRRSSTSRRRIDILQSVLPTLVGRRHASTIDENSRRCDGHFIVTLSQASHRFGEGGLQHVATVRRPRRWITCATERHVDLSARRNDADDFDRRSTTTCWPRRPKRSSSICRRRKMRSCPTARPWAMILDDEMPVTLAIDDVSCPRATSRERSTPCSP